MVLDVAACTAAVEDVCVTTWKRGVAEMVVGELVLFLEMEVSVGRIYLTEYSAGYERLSPGLKLGVH